MHRGRTTWRRLADHLSGLFSGRRANRPAPRSRRLGIEPLERRALLAVATVTASDSSAAELGNDPGAFVISLSDAQPSPEYTVTFELAGTAGWEDYVMTGADWSYYGSGYQVTFPDGSGSKSVTITPINDARDDGTDSVVLNLTGIYGGCGGGCCCGCCGGGNSIGSPSSATITIQDDDDWTIGVEPPITGGYAIEAAPYMSSYRFYRSGGSDDRYPITVNFYMSGEAQRNTDYVLRAFDLSTIVYGNSVTIPANAREAVLFIDPLNDATRESDETATLILSSATSGGIQDEGVNACGCGAWGAGGPFEIDSGHSNATVTILDDDDWKVGIVAAEPEGREPGEPLAIKNGRYKIERTPGREVVYEMDASYALPVSFETEAAPEPNASATRNADYVLYQGYNVLTDYVYIAAGQTEVEVNLRVSGDAQPEPEEQAILKVVLPSNCCGCGGSEPDPYTIAANDSATVTIEDNDWRVTVAVGDAVAKEARDTSHSPPGIDRAWLTFQRDGSGSPDYPLEVKFEIPRGHKTTAPYECRATARVDSVDYWDFEFGWFEDTDFPGGSVSLAVNEARGVYEGVVLIPAGTDLLEVCVTPNDDQYVESTEMAEVVRITAVAQTGCGYYGCEPGICYEVDAQSSQATVTIEDNDSAQLFAVTYLNANHVTTDPAYDAPEFADWEKGVEISEDHWFDKDVGISAGLPEGHPARRHTKDHAYPTSYVRGASLNLKGELLGMAEPGYSMIVTAVAVDWSLPFALNVTSDAASGVTTTTATLWDPTWLWANQVRYYASYDLNWKSVVVPPAVGGGFDPSAWQDIGASNNEMYFTYAQPTVSPLYHTVVHLGTVNPAAVSADSEAEVIAAIWGEFADRNVSRRDGQQLTYYGGQINPLHPQDHERTAIGLIEYKAGRCGAWAQLLNHVLRSQGIANSLRTIVPKDKPNRIEVGFGINPSLGGQGNDAPWNHFTDLDVIWLNNMIYDPSYGASHTSPNGSLIAWENAALLAVASDSNGDGVVELEYNATMQEETQWSD